MITRSDVGHNYAEDNINKSENEEEIERKRGSGLSLLECDA